MTRRNIFFIAASSIILAFPTMLMAKETAYWYIPHYLQSAEEASNRIQFMSPQFAPMILQNGKWWLTRGYHLDRFDANRLGMNLSFSKSGVATSTQYFWSWTGGYNAPVSSSYKYDVTVTFDYSDMSFFKVWYFADSPTFPSRWCAVTIDKVSTTRNDVLCVSSEADVHALIDAIATIAVASGAKLGYPTGMWLGALPEKEMKKHPGQTGCRVTSTELQGPPERAGIPEGRHHQDDQW